MAERCDTQSLARSAERPDRESTSRTANVGRSDFRSRHRDDPRNPPQLFTFRYFDKQRRKWKTTVKLGHDVVWDMYHEMSKSCETEYPKPVNDQLSLL